MTNEMNGWLIVFGTFLPLYGLIFTFILAVVLKGPARNKLLIGGPITIFGFCLLVAKTVSSNGNLLFAALFALLIIFVFLYYPILLSVMVVQKILEKNKGR